MNRTYLTLLLFCFTQTAEAIEQLEVQGLFSNKAVLLIDGKRHILAVNETSPEGVKVISANSLGAVLEVEGQKKQYNLANTVTVKTEFTKRQSQKETIYINSSGMYKTFGNINARPVPFLVDTGASAISMNSVQAKQLGIRYKRTGTPASVSTASGFVKAYRVHLQSVSVGDIKQNNVEAFVLEGNHPGPILLGMTFLGHLTVTHSGNAMTLMQKD